MFETARSIVAGQHTIAELVPRIKRQGDFKHVVIVTQPSIKTMGVIDRIETELSHAGISTRCYTDVKPEPTVDNIQQVYSRIASEPVDLFIGIGGGSVLDATKLFSVLMTDPVDVMSLIGIDRVSKPGIPTVLIPTTSGTGSEVTPNAIVTIPEQELKVGIISRHLLPMLVIIDPALTVSLPPNITAATGMDAFTHALESYISTKANPISDMFALESIRLLSGSLLQAYHHGSDLQARENVLLGSMYGGMALSSAGTAAVHALAYPLGGKFNITHGVANSMLLPHVMTFNMDAIERRLGHVACAMGLQIGTEGGKAVSEAVIRLIFEWASEMDIPQNLRAFGVTDEDIGELAVAASKVTRLLHNNPKPMNIDDMQAVYRQLLP
ncbi:iron-containing alcohol dehydrogenase [Paenibacillus sp. CGMCC 1.16610]|uniref:Iron-containing alcohol dehydrogenase n=1 Tax=Paenibacillus anseongense TaxID=2682845 RepID=A0ABW9UF05_9BACL|nr:MULTISPECIES: iron-containing alcohol dehydrogenase [Paenibacillus]MBA2938546.1 iron-containing alcohol dehydrogenase [Paenibacillus sp. CGMCC 1.16610]MVQ38739.1 iron-containing alcohol dehydrogenase [Paenibacillus anseongense]